MVHIILDTSSNSLIFAVTIGFIVGATGGAISSFAEWNYRRKQKRTITPR